MGTLTKSWVTHHQDAWAIVRAGVAGGLVGEVRVNFDLHLGVALARECLQAAVRQCLRVIRYFPIARYAASTSTSLVFSHVLVPTQQLTAEIARDFACLKPYDQRHKFDHSRVTYSWCSMRFRSGFKCHSTQISVCFGLYPVRELFVERPLDLHCRHEQAVMWALQACPGYQSE
ncbi:hypothetical protein BDY19DRAFT_996761 [Irpex rosettiformis]|uniref:Uncharacterized protein n=1 Tax=Irpex rosettiformis TaxID=378272 RepID=A0ACB8TTR7_9APHY|nr:hypothetical protein BDY19DRAFT_996761 [Irpex rosettiformis]